MNEIESIAQTSVALPEKYAELLDSPPLNDYRKRQIQLAVEKFGLEHPNDSIDKQTLNDILMSWADADSSPNYSKVWSDFVTNPDFKEHTRFKGDYSNVTLEDLEYFIKNRKLPE